MNVAIICEYSGRVRNEFELLGHAATSYDILPTLIPGKHIQGDISLLPPEHWLKYDLAICFPPCTYLSYAGNRHFNAPGREDKKNKGFAFFMMCINLPIDRICVENPVGYPNSYYRKPDQIIHPFYFGENEMKRTCLWLKNLPLLEHKYINFRDIPKPNYIDSSGKNRYFTEAMKGNKEDRTMNRNKTFISIAKAMAEQWSNIKYEQLKLM